LREMGIENEWSNEALDSLGGSFSIRDLETAMEHTAKCGASIALRFQGTIDCV